MRFLLLLSVLVSGAASAQQLPDLQPGKWKLSGMNDATTCGHPLKSTYDEIAQFAKLREMGCKVDVNNPKPRSVAVIVACPADSKLGKVDTAFTISSPNPQSFTIDTSLKGKRNTLNGVRIGEC